MQVYKHEGGKRNQYHLIINYFSLKRWFIFNVLIYIWTRFDCIIFGHSCTTTYSADYSSRLRNYVSINQLIEDVK
jgi:hypothetical protein